jgi:hypothetical protein
MASHDSWLDDRNRLASELHKSMTDDEIRAELRGRWGIEAEPDESDPALTLANVRLSQETQGDETTST